MKKVLIIGGHGKIALQLSSLLTADGVEVSAVIRNPAQVDDVAATGATPVVHDVVSSSVEELAALFAGHDAVVWSAGAGGGTPERTYAVDRDAAIRSMDAAELAGVSRYVMVSYLGAGADHGVDPQDGFFAYAQAKADADTHLKASALSWTILGPGALTEEAGTGLITTAVDSNNTNTARANVALVAAAVLARPDTVLRTIGFTDGQTPLEQALTP
ncbi:NAD(P)H-binding protein [Arthrobacter cryoconiti]|uniref:NAD(P)H-binding protein n=1 Tax=Arthrobacter cryoconiti TaxID=748907 RepID=A0ABV8QZ62_9MICC|nr:NAD(P)H-binding protein [Arthrobacter cryoconiti]MCC9069930.1 NAD(P)H-binding protein [Arthrobacter cryoconiti]